tara:strand:+ start:808 stop:1206 length:399 start_codon:yes stop_codon:yes gene_type:complete
MAKKEPSFNKEYLSEKIELIREKLGDAYGGPLLEELIIRMERTVAHFDYEVDEMLKKVTSRTTDRKTTLANIRGEEVNEEASEFESKLDSLESGKEGIVTNKNKEDSNVDESKEGEKKKKGFFSFLKRKKKK